MRNNAGLYHALKGMEVIQYQDVIGDALQSIIASRKDTDGVEYYGLLTHAIYDAECLPHAHALFQGSYGLADTPEVHQAVQTARRKCARSAMRILTESAKHSVAQCPNTAYLLLKEIGLWWRDTQDEAEAVCMLECLRDIGRDLPTYGNYVGEKWDRVLREVTDSRFPRARIIEHLKKLTFRLPSVAHYRFPVKDSDETMARILALAWLRNQEMQKFADEIHILEPIRQASSAAHDLLVNSIQRIADLETAVGKLIKLVSEIDLGKSGLAVAQRNLSFTYPSDGKVFITSSLRVDENMSLKGVDKAVKTDFESIKYHVSKWQHEHGQYLVRIRVDAFLREATIPLSFHDSKSSGESSGYKRWIGQSV